MSASFEGISLLYGHYVLVLECLQQNIRLQKTKNFYGYDDDDTVDTEEEIRCIFDDI